MGKSKKSRNGGKKGAVGGSPYTKDSTKKDSEQESGGVWGDLNSLDESKRLNACRLLIGVFESSKGASFENIATPKLFSLLCMRLVDSSITVRIEAAGALRNMACSNHGTVVKKMVDVGVVRTALGIISQYCSTSAEQSSVFEGIPLESQIQIVEQMLATVSGLISNCEEACDDLIEVPETFTMLCQLLVSGNNMILQKGAANILAVATDGNLPACEQIVRAGGVAPLKDIVINSASSTAFVGNFPDSSIFLGISCAGILVNIFSCSPNEIQEQCMLELVIDKITGNLPLNDQMLQVLLTGNQEQQDQSENVLVTALSVVQSACETLANFAVLIKTEENDIISPSKERLLKFCTDRNVCGLANMCLKQQHTILNTLATSLKNKTGLISTTTLAVLDCIDRSSIVHLNFLEIGAANPIIAQLNPMDLIQDLLLTADLLVESVQNITKSSDADGTKNLRWGMKEGIIETDVMKLFTTCCTTTIGVIASIIRNCSIPDAEAATRSISTLLCRAIMMPNFEIASSGVELLSFMAGILPGPLNGLLTNTLLRRMANPATFKSVETDDYQTVIQDTSMLMVATSMEAIIDLHSSDDPIYLANFVKLQALEKSRSACVELQRQLTTDAIVSQEHRGNIQALLATANDFIEYKAANGGI